MKKILVALLLAGGLASGVFAGSTSITLTPPVVTAWQQTISGFTYNATPSDLSSLNSQLTTEFGNLQLQLNNQYFSKMHDFTQLAQGFSNANMAAFDNASLLGYQTYDLFAIMLGADLGLAVPTLDPSSATSALNDVVNKGDVYVGMATGGFAGQVGLNLSFLVPRLYLTAKAGFVPEMPLNGISYQQGMFGIGVNYTLIPQFDFLFGFIKWRGVSVGSGFTYNANSVTADLAIPQQDSGNFTATIGGQSVTASASATNIKAKLTVKDSSLVIPIDLMTSLQALWFLNFGLGVGADLSFSSAQIKLGGASDLILNGITGATMNPGSVALTATDTNGGGDVFVPRLAASVGLDLAIFKIDVPVSFYPTTKAFAVGVTGGIVW